MKNVCLNYTASNLFEKLVEYIEEKPVDCYGWREDFIIISWIVDRVIEARAVYTGASGDCVGLYTHLKLLTLDLALLSSYRSRWWFSSPPGLHVHTYRIQAI